MNRLTDEALAINGSTPPEVPPDFPFPPAPQVPQHPEVSVPMIYVNERERVEYTVKEYEQLDAKQLGHDLGELGRDGWWLTQIVPYDGRTLIILCRSVRG